MCFHQIGCLGYVLYFVVFVLIRVLRLFIKTWIAIYTLHFGPTLPLTKKTVTIWWSYCVCVYAVCQHHVFRAELTQCHSIKIVMCMCVY